MVREIKDWIVVPLVLQSPQGSAWHKVQEAAKHKRLYTLKTAGDALGHAELSGDFVSLNVFVIGHDWAKAFQGATDFEGGDVRLPFDACVFEFRISGRRVCILLGRGDNIGENGRPADKGIIFVSGGHDLWCALGPPQSDGPLSELITAQVRAICIALDAEVAVSEVERAPAKLNQARERKGLTPLKDYHVVSLTRRARAEPTHRSGDQEPRWRVRLHFRRGHWRLQHEEASDHCEHLWQGAEDRLGRYYCTNCASYRRWIRWQLCGNPDLGFIEKHYTL